MHAQLFTAIIALLAIASDNTLASPLTTELFNYMQSLNTSAFFIGISKDSSKGDREAQYVTKEGKRLSDLPKAVSDAIERLDGTQGDCLSMDRNGIHVVSCETELPYLCYSNETTHCGYGCMYSNVTGSAYKFHTSQIMTWDRASATCEAGGSYLVEINDAAEVTVLTDIMATVTYFAPWIGLRDRRTGGASDWRSVRGEPLEQIYHEWHRNRSNNTNYGCAYLNSDKLLNNYDCEDERYFICEISE